MAAQAVPLVLVVDDDSDARATMRELLASHAYKVVEAVNGRQALHYLSGDGPQPQLILLDLVMPEMSGWELMMLTQTYSRLARIPIIVTTGVQSLQELMGRGIAACLRKPLKGDDLFRAIDFALSGSGLQPASGRTGC
jgi:CheY-like chemotaxis protein